MTLHLCPDVHVIRSKKCPVLSKCEPLRYCKISVSICVFRWARIRVTVYVSLMRKTRSTPSDLCCLFFPPQVRVSGHSVTLIDISLHLSDCSTGHTCNRDL